MEGISLAPVLSRTEMIQQRAHVLEPIRKPPAMQITDPTTQVTKMSDQKQPFLSQRRLVLILILLLISVVGIGLYASRAARLRQNSASPLIGTWRGERGNVLNFRPDGTARSRFSTGPEIGYMEWSINESGGLLIYQFSSRNGVGAWISPALRATGRLSPTDRWEIVEISPTQMKLQMSYRDPKTRKPITTVYTFTRVQDQQLETAP